MKEVLIERLEETKWAEWTYFLTMKLSVVFGLGAFAFSEPGMAAPFFLVFLILIPIAFINRRLLNSTAEQLENYSCQPE